MGMIDVPTTPGMTDVPNNPSMASGGYQGGMANVPNSPGMIDVPGHNYNQGGMFQTGYNQQNMPPNQKQKKSGGVLGTIFNIIIILFFVFVGLGIYSSDGDTIPQKIRTYVKDMMQLQQSLQREGGSNGGDD